MDDEATRGLTAEGWLRGMNMVSSYPAGMLPQAWEATKRADKLCRTYWGTHGCSKKDGHKSAKHVCRDRDTGKVCHAITEVSHWGQHTDTIIMVKGRWGVDKQGYLWSIYE